MTWIYLLGGGFLLYLGAEWFVGGASRLALGLRVPQIIVGLTVVAYGTSFPEVIVGFQAAATGAGDVALGNVLGSNVANIGLILGAAAIIKPAAVHRGLLRRELPILAASTLILPLLLLDGVVGRGEALALLAAALAYTVWMVRDAGAASVAKAESSAEVIAEVADAAGGPELHSLWRSSLVAVVGLALLLVGGRLFIDGAVAIARDLGMSDRLVGLTIVAVGTSLPELITAIIAALRGFADLAVGNVIGSNIFNVLLCLPAAALAGPIGAPLEAVVVDLGGLGVMTALALAFLRSDRLVTRREGAALVAVYVAFTALVVARG